MSAGRIAWIDYAKGIGIILVVMSAAAIGYGAPEGGVNWMLGLADWARPFVVPAFFLISGQDATDEVWRAVAWRDEVVGMPRRPTCLQFFSSNGVRHRFPDLRPGRHRRGLACGGLA